MKGKGIMVANKDWYDGYERTFSKKKCPGCMEIEEIFKQMPALISGICPDCGEIIQNKTRGE